MEYFGITKIPESFIKICHVINANITPIELIKNISTKIYNEKEVNIIPPIETDKLTNTNALSIEITDLPV